MSVPQSHGAISALTYPHPLWRYLLLFQSWSQLGSWLLIVLASTLPMHALLMGQKGAPPLAALLCGTSLGSLVSVCMVLPVRFSVASAGAASMRSLLDTLARLGSVQDRRSGASAVYLQKLPRVLRWNEGAVRIAQHRGAIVVSGPRSIVGRMRKAVLKSAPVCVSENVSD
ncbi:hypothetical protein F2P45_31825 [Massilia sp. CCM 8733]|uniref:Uncharacterized protein n=1 Tax=Massilia mucilaginosa TaxID=2609282 RepID=A0ABX0P397_9BURK|nr:hypothetical protein [Massilia mucilaginosa]NHZ93557.1 hypothetical protein [Massilia mucilaginosa]